MNSKCEKLSIHDSNNNALLNANFDSRNIYVGELVPINNDHNDENNDDNNTNNNLLNNNTNNNLLNNNNDNNVNPTNINTGTVNDVNDLSNIEDFFDDETNINALISNLKKN